MTTNAILGADITFDKGEQAVREWAARAGPVVQYLTAHFTLFYGGRAFSPAWPDFFEQFADPGHPLYAEKPRPVGIVCFYNAKKHYHALAIEYDWPAGAAVNRAVAGNDALNTPGSNLLKGFNGDRYKAHVTIAYIHGDVIVDLEALRAAAPPLDFFDVTVKGPTLEMDMKPRAPPA